MRLQFGEPLRREIRVEVGGEVATPGVYTLSAGARVADAILAAGGVTADADLGRVNEASDLVDGQALVIPRAGATPASGLVDLNVATTAQL